MSKNTHLIADWDGALANTGKLNFGLVQMLHPEVEAAHYYIDHHRGNVYERPVVPFTPETSRAYDQLYADAVSVDHLRESLPAIHELGRAHRLHIVTSNSGETIWRILRRAGVEHYFGHVLGFEAHASKVEKFRQLCTVEGFAAESSLYLTDTVGDIHEARKVGLRTLAVSFGYQPPEVLAEGEPDAIAHSWDEVLEHARHLMSRSGDLIDS